jgi:hypothetical protein
MYRKAVHMQIVDNHIVSATENELFSEYLRRGFDDCIDFHEYLNRMIDCGVEIEQGKSEA